MKDNIPDLKFERIIDGLGEGLIMLEQYDNGEEGRVAIHPLHLRHLAETFGLVATCDPLAQKTVNTLTRRLKLLEGRISYLADYLANHSDHKHADLSFEMTYARATADIAAEFCAELVDQAGTDTEETDVGTMAASCGHGASTMQASLL